MDDAEEVIIAMAQADPVGLASLDSGGKYLVPPHIEKLNQLLLDVADGKIKRLRISMPPRHGKSELTSKYFVAWYIATHPDQRIILASYGSDFAASWGRKARNVLETWGPRCSALRSLTTARRPTTGTSRGTPGEWSRPASGLASPAGAATS